jgi:hypothetical protein
MEQYCCAKVTAILDKLPIVKNLARKEFNVLFVLTMRKGRAVQFCEIAQELNDEVKASSNEAQIQDFFNLKSYPQISLSSLHDKSPLVHPSDHHCSPIRRYFALVCGQCSTA